MCLYIIHFLLTVNYDKMWVQTHFLLLFVNKMYPETYILYYKKWVKLFYKVNLAAFYQFLSDPGVPGVRSMGPDV